MDQKSIDVMKALWLFHQNQLEATYNNLYELTTKFGWGMARQTFQRKLENLKSAGYVVETKKKESRLHFQPTVYELSKRGLQAVSLWSTLIRYKEKQKEEADKISQIDLFERIVKKTTLAASSVPIFILLGHDEFIKTYIYDLAITWIEIMKKRMHADMEEALKTLLPYALAQSTELSGEPLPASTIEDIKECIRQRGLDPEEVFDKAEKIRGDSKDWLSYIGAGNYREA